MTGKGEESLAWDRVGRFLQESGSRASEIADRNVQLWSSVSSHLKKDKYSADDMADDVAKSMTVALNNVSDMWLMLTREPRQNQIAQPLPTAFLLFDWTGPYRHRLLEPVRIEVDFDLRGRVLPQMAKIALNGTRTPASDKERAIARASAEAAAKAREAARAGQAGDEPAPAAPEAAVSGTPPAESGTPSEGNVATSEDGVTRLLECIVARREGTSPVYVVETLNRRIVGGGVDPDAAVYEGLVPGVYDGIVYLIDPPLALANLRILVEGEPQPPAEPRPPVSDRPTTQTAGTLLNNGVA